ncbi:TPA: hypothetical protein ACTZ5A_005384 [Bacillus cereus]
MFSRDITHTSVKYELYEINRTYEWQTIKGAANTVAATSESIVEAMYSINELYIRVKQERQPQEKMCKTLNINKGVGTALDDFADKHK